MTWRDEIEGSQYVPAFAFPEMEDALARARAVGGERLSYVGIGMTGVVLREGEVSFKIGRTKDPTLFSLLETEYEWLLDAHRVDPKHVVRPLAWFPDEVVIVRDYVEGRPYGWAPREVGQHFDHLARQMVQLDWGMPEFKDDSYVRLGEAPAWLTGEESDFVLVDGGMANRLCMRLVVWLEEWLDGERHPWTVGSLGKSTLAFLVRREVQEGCVDAKIGAALEARVAGSLIENRAIPNDWRYAARRHAARAERPIVR